MKARDPLEVAIAEKLARDCPYGFEHMKAGPSAADYHAARIALRTIEELYGYEYAIWHSFPDSESLKDYSYVVGGWSDEKDRTYMLERLQGDDATGEYKLIKRRKAGPVEDV